VKLSREEIEKMPIDELLLKQKRGRKKYRLVHTPLGSRRTGEKTVLISKTFYGKFLKN